MVLLAGRDLDLQRRLGGDLVIDLEGRVVDVEALSEERLQAPAQLVAVVAGASDDVGRRRSIASTSSLSTMASPMRPSRSEVIRSDGIGCQPKPASASITSS